MALFVSCMNKTKIESYGGHAIIGYRLLII